MHDDVGPDARAELARSRREEVLVGTVSTLSSAEREALGALVAKLLDRSVVLSSSQWAAMRTCWLCDYAACASCPMQKFVAAGDADA